MTSNKNWRQATDTVDVSGYTKFQTAYTDSNGVVIGFSSGTNKIEKYYKSSPADILYKKVYDPEFIVNIFNKTTNTYVAKKVFSNGSTEPLTATLSEWSADNHSSSAPTVFPITINAGFVDSYENFTGGIRKVSLSGSNLTAGVVGGTDHYLHNGDWDGSTFAGWDTVLGAGSFRQVSTTNFSSVSNTTINDTLYRTRYVNGYWVRLGGTGTHGKYSYATTLGGTYTTVSTAPFVSADGGIVDLKYIGGYYYFFFLSGGTITRRKVASISPNWLFGVLEEKTVVFAGSDIFSYTGYATEDARFFIGGITSTYGKYNKIADMDTQTLIDTSTSLKNHLVSFRSGNYMLVKSGAISIGDATTVFTNSPIASLASWNTNQDTSYGVFIARLV